MIGSIDLPMKSNAYPVVPFVVILVIALIILIEGMYRRNPLFFSHIG